MTIEQERRLLRHRALCHSAARDAKANTARLKELKRQADDLLITMRLQAINRWLLDR